MPRITTRARPIALILIGAALGATLVAPVAAQVTRSAPDAVITTTQARSASCAGLAFHPLNSATQFGYSGTRLFRSGATGDGFFVCDPGLPHRAVVKTVWFLAYDADPNGNIRDCALVRVSIAGAETDFQVMAAAASTFISDASGTVNLGAGIDIANPTIDNNAFGYFLQCRLNSTSNLVGLYGARVTYRISSTDG